MSKFLGSLGIARSELRLLDEAGDTPSSVAQEVVQTLADTGEFHQGVWRLPSGESVSFEMVSWEAEPPGPGELWRLPEADEGLPAPDDDSDVAGGSSSSSRLSLLPAECLALVAAHLSLRDLAAACAASPAFRRLARGDACWLERLRRHFGCERLRGCFRRAVEDPCCRNPFARIFCHALFGLYRARPEGGGGADVGASEQQQQQQQRPVPDSWLAGALFQRPLLSPVFLGRPLVMEFRLPEVHPGAYDVLLRVKKLLCDPLDSESVASAADSSGVRVPLLQARINRRNVTISNFECAIEVTTASNGDQLEPLVLLTDETVSHLLQNYSMPPDRWFYWRLTSLELRAENALRDLKFRVSVMRRGVADATVTQEEFERELRNALLVDHLFLRLHQNHQQLSQPC